jgi:hypothetical protein
MGSVCGLIRSILGLAIDPIAWFAFLMSDGCDPDDLVQIEIVEAIREPLEEASLKASLSVGWPSVRVTSDEPDEGLDFFLEGDSCFQLGISRRVEDDRLHEYLARISAKTCSAGLPVTFPDRISSDLRASSASQAASTPSSGPFSKDSIRK